MHLLLIFFVSEIVAVLLVVTLCMAARRGARKMEHALSVDDAAGRPARGESAARGAGPVGRRAAHLWRSWRRNRDSGLD
jgi:hypothetical protein